MCMPTRIQTGRKLSKMERLRSDYQDKREIRDKLLAGADEDGNFNGVMTEADQRRLAKLINQSVRTKR